MSLATRQLIVLLSGTETRRRRTSGRVEQLVQSLDWDATADALARARLLATLGPRLIDLAGPSADEQFEHLVAEALASGRRQSALLQMIAQLALDSLAAAGIRASLLKGPLLGEALYGDPARRSASDIDLLVEPKLLAHAVEVVRRLGYAAPGDRVDEHGLPLLHFALGHEDRELPPIELHWRIHWYESSFATERLLAPLSQGGSWRPAPADELAALLLFYARDGFLALRHACDIAAWWDARGEELADGELDALIARHPALGPVLRSGLAVAGHVVGLPAASIAGDRSRLRARERVAIRLAHAPSARSEPQQYAQMGLIDGLLAPPGGLGGFAERQLKPPRTATGDGHHPRRGYAAHALRLLGRYALELLGLLRTPRGSYARRAIQPDRA
jgi:Uncharacterised nucleotidyltransferase